MKHLNLIIFLIACESTVDSPATVSKEIQVIHLDEPINFSIQAIEPQKKIEPDFKIFAKSILKASKKSKIRLKIIDSELNESLFFPLQLIKITPIKKRLSSATLSNLFKERYTLKFAEAL